MKKEEFTEKMRKSYEDIRLRHEHFTCNALERNFSESSFRGKTIIKYEKFLLESLELNCNADTIGSIMKNVGIAKPKSLMKFRLFCLMMFWQHCLETKAYRRL